MSLILYLHFSLHMFFKHVRSEFFYFSFQYFMVKFFKDCATCPKSLYQIIW